MRRTKIFSFLLFICIVGGATEALGQNLLRNSGFEERAFLVLASKPDSESQLHNKCKHWRSYGRSSDWYSTDSYNLCFDASCLSDGFCQITTGSPMTSHTAEHYAGFGFCEGIQQKLTGTTTNDLARLDFWWSPRDCMGNTNIRTYLLKDHAPFNQVPADCANPSLGQNMSFVSVNVNTAGPNPEHIPGVWYHFVSDWVAVGNYDWLLIKGENKPGPGTLNEESYIYIDDVSLLNQDECCIHEMLYETSNDLPNTTHVEDFIRAGNDAGIPGVSGPVTVPSGHNVTFKAGNFIDLLPGFEASNGSQFEAKIEECNNTTNSTNGGAIFILNFPNFFTPNGDGIYDYYMVHQENATHYDVVVYKSDGGQQIYHESGEITTNPFIVWDGICDEHCSPNPPCNGDLDVTVDLQLSNCDSELTLSKEVYICPPGGKYEDTDPESQQGNANGIVNFDSAIPAEASEVDSITLTQQDYITAQNKINVFPNPNSGSFILEIQDSPEEQVEIEIFHINGMRVFTKQLFLREGPIYSFELNITDQSAGIYYLKINSTHTRYVTQKIILY